MERLPASLKVLFSTYFEGFPSYRTPSLQRASAVEQTLTKLGVSFRTKITRIKRKQVLYVVLLANT